MLVALFWPSSVLITPCKHMFLCVAAIICRQSVTLYVLALQH